MASFPVTDFPGRNAMRRSIVGGVATAALGMAGPAFAIEAQQVGERLRVEERPLVGVDVRLGLGNFTGDLGSNTKVGPLLGINASAYPWQYGGVEVGYEGQRFPIDDSRLRDNGDGEGVWRHNATLLAKAGPLIDEKWRPFVGAGVGLSYLNPSDGADRFYNNDWQTELPLAAGLDYRFGNLVAGARATYRFVGGEGLLRNPVTNADEKGSLFNGNVMIGGQF
ncbi:hypothetical protein [Myxococcus sp. CA027]|uniref:hypothetical protein n=2 Tax=Myxococcaceae TaxID=31 RepID=UPI0011429F4F|nr:hypothetical protein [Myxococcus xanthus]